MQHVVYSISHHHSSNLCVPNIWPSFAVLFLVSSVLGKRMAGNSISKITHFVLKWTQNLISVSQPIMTAAVEHYRRQRSALVTIPNTLLRHLID